MRTRSLRALTALLLAVGLMAACGNDDDTATPGPDDDGATAPVDDGGSNGGGDDDAWPPSDLRGTGAAGTVTVDGTTYTIDAVRECDVTDFFVGDNAERQYMVEGIGLEDPEVDWSDEVVITVYTGIQTNPDQDEQGMGWDGPEGLYDNSAVGVGDGPWTSGTDTLDEPPLEISDDRITGELFLRSSLGNPPVDVTADIATPTTGPVDCD